MASKHLVGKVMAVVVLWSLAALVRAEVPPPAGGSGYTKATEGNEVVLNKMYPKKQRVELNLLEAGFIMNEAFVNSELVHGSLIYFPNEVWGFGLDGTYVINQDKPERTCVENFYNDPDGEVGPECGKSDNVPGNGTNHRANMGPAYMPIRQLKYVLTATALYNLAYGKQLYFLSATQYFDLYFMFAGGLAFSDYYPLETNLRNGNKSRGDFPPAGSNTPTPGAPPSATDQYGTAGRPAPLAQTTPTIDVGVGQKIHFGKTMNFKLELRDYLLVGTPGGFETYFAVIAGLGMRF